MIKQLYLQINQIHKVLESWIQLCKIEQLQLPGKLQQQQIKIILSLHSLVQATKMSSIWLASRKLERLWRMMNLKRKSIVERVVLKSPKEN